MKKSKKAPINTSKEDDKEGRLATMIVMGQDPFVKGQEAEGQREFVNSSTLPTEMSPPDKKTLKTAGVKFLGPVEGDPLFQYVELPSVWQCRSTESGMHSELVDEKGEVRAVIFYKAAFYDRRADLRIPR